MPSVDAALVKVPASTTRTKARIAESWSIRTPPEWRRLILRLDYFCMETMKLAGAYLFLGAEAIHFVVQQFVTFVLRRSGASPRRTRFRSMAIECKDEMMRWEAVDIPVRIYR